ncbi:MAG TPA: cytochrome c maturation protein CcmE [Cyclobacteriaceae bacterium]
MKKTHLFGIVVIAVLVIIIISTIGDASQYVDFDKAKYLYKTGNTEKIHVVGTLMKDDLGNVIGIKHSPDQLSFSFNMVDEKNNAQKVIYNEPMPTDFLKSEKVVVVGSYYNDLFVADKILLKCPSKYQEDEIKV